MGSGISSPSIESLTSAEKTEISRLIGEKYELLKGSEKCKSDKELFHALKE
jgi:hypothetical protein